MKLCLASVTLALLLPPASWAEVAQTSLLAITRDGHVLQIEVATGAVSPLATTALSDVLALERGANGAYYAIAGWNQLVTVDPGTGASAPIAALPYDFVADLAPGGDGLLAAADADGIGEAELLVAIDPATGASHAIGPFDDPAYEFDTPFLAFGVAVAPDAALFASLFSFAPGDAVLAEVDPATGAPAEGVPMPGIFSGLDFGPDGVLYAVEQVFVGPNPGSFAVAIDPASGAVTRLSSAPLGLELVPGDCANGVDDDLDGVADGDDAGCQVWALDAGPPPPGRVARCGLGAEGAFVLAALARRARRLRSRALLLAPRSSEG